MWTIIGFVLTVAFPFALYYLVTGGIAIYRRATAAWNLLAEEGHALLGGSDVKVVLPGEK
jgi:hypothetical protein